MNEYTAIDKTNSLLVNDSSTKDSKLINDFCLIIKRMTPNDTITEENDYIEDFNIGMYHSDELICNVELIYKNDKSYVVRIDDKDRLFYCDITSEDAKAFIDIYSDNRISVTNISEKVDFDKIAKISAYSADELYSSDNVDEFCNLIKNLKPYDDTIDGPSVLGFVQIDAYDSSDKLLYSFSLMTKNENKNVLFIDVDDVYFTCEMTQEQADTFSEIYRQICKS